MIESLIRDGIDFLLHNPIGQLILITIEALALIGPLLIAVAYLTYAERKVLAAMQLRKGPNVVGPFGLFQPFADAIKMVTKETIIPAGANKVLFILAPIAGIAPALAAWVEDEVRPGPAAASDEALVDYLRATGATAYHPVGTCRMGQDADSSVVDPQFRVHGIRGLRVADGSVMPSIASTNTNAICIVFGERVADFIAQEEGVPL